MFDRGRAAADLRLLFQQTHFDAARGQQRSGGQSSDAAADYDYFVIHRLFEKVEERPVDRMLTPKFKGGANVGLEHNDDRLDAIENQVNDEAGKQPSGPRANHR